MWHWCDAIWVCTTDKYQHRPDRLPRALRLLREELQIPSEKIFTNIMKHGNQPTHGLCCTENHLECYRQALDHGHDTILVIEDDVDVHKHIDLRRTLENVENFLTSDNQWNILFFGCFAQQMDAVEDIVARRNTYQIRRAACWSLHGYVINKRTMEFMTKFEPREIVEYAERELPKMPTIDRFLQSFPTHPSLDGFYVLCARSKQLNCFTIYPHLFYQHSYKSSKGYSYILEPAIAATGDWIFVLMWIILGTLLVLLIVLIGLVAFFTKK